jgi:hypothetical protein
MFLGHTATLWLSILLVPILPALVDILGPLRASRRADPSFHEVGRSDDWTILVPLYGSMRFLTNRDWLASFAERVTIVTTDSETPEFEAELTALCSSHGWHHHRVTPQRATTASGKRQTHSTLRDQLIRDGMRHVRSSHVITIDADTRLGIEPSMIVRNLEVHNLDIASARLVPKNTGTLLGKLQAHEYRIVMRLRRLLPWMVSGAFQVSRTAAMRAVMERHSMFFQGNDAEIGLLGQQLGYRVGWLPTAVPTDVPDTWRSWIRQRWAWAGGEFRLWVVNGPRLFRKHPFFIGYGALVVTVMWPLREWTLVHSTWQLLGIAAIYLLLVGVINRKHLDPAILLYPLYGLVYSLIFVPCGLVSYVQQAVGSRNLGIIRHNRRPDLEVSESRPAGPEVAEADAFGAHDRFTPAA